MVAQLVQQQVAGLGENARSHRGFARSRVSYRDVIHIRKDIIAALMEHGELNQSRLISYCNLNHSKHKHILNDLVEKGIIERSFLEWGNSVMIKYGVTGKGIQFLTQIIRPYETMFPRQDDCSTRLIEQ